MKYPQACCALCGSLIQGKGWFCSFKCDKHEADQRAERYHEQEAKRLGARVDGKRFQAGKAL